MCFNFFFFSTMFLLGVYMIILINKRSVGMKEVKGKKNEKEICCR